MAHNIITTELIEKFKISLIQAEKSPATIEKYLRDVRSFLQFAAGKELTKFLVMDYKQHLINRYAPASVNSMLASVNHLLEFLGAVDCRVKTVKLQRAVYCPAERELTRAEYTRLLTAAEKDEQLWLIMQTICSTGIRVSELCHFTMDAMKNGELTVRCKGKIRSILLPSKLRKRLLDYAKRKGIASGCIFRNRRGNPLNRSCIWARMKALCARAKVDSRKVFPHNLRKLFARTFYRIEKDIAKLADILGHSSIDTTRIYIMSTGAEHRRKIERLELVV